jgi:muconolactone delta-isomerase
MNDSLVLESLLINGESRRALDVIGGIKTVDLEVVGQSLLNSVDVQSSINVGKDVNICGELRCDKFFNIDDTNSLILRKSLLPDTHSSNTKRYDLGNDKRRWENIWVKNLNAMRADLIHLTADTSKIGSLETSSIVTETIQADSYTYNYRKLDVDDQEIIELNTQITLLKPSSPYVTIEIVPIGGYGSRLEIIALGTLNIGIYEKAGVETIKKGTSIRLFNMDGEWLLYY